MKIMNVIQVEGNDKIKSYTVLKTKRFDASLMILQQGQQIPPHTSPADTMVLVLAGRMAFMLNEEVTVLETGDVRTFRANEIHALQALETSRFLLVK